MEEVKNNSINLFEIIKVFKWKFTKKNMRDLIINYFYVNNIQDIETIDTFLTLMKMNLKRKNILFLHFVLKIWENAKKYMIKF
jgi:hypothetical protein